MVKHFLLIVWKQAIVIPNTIQQYQQKISTLFQKHKTANLRHYSSPGPFSRLNLVRHYSLALGKSTGLCTMAANSPFELATRTSGVWISCTPARFRVKQGARCWTVIHFHTQRNLQCFDKNFLDRRPSALRVWAHDSVCFVLNGLRPVWTADGKTMFS